MIETGVFNTLHFVLGVKAKVVNRNTCTAGLGLDFSGDRVLILPFNEWRVTYRVWAMAGLSQRTKKPNTNASGNLRDLVNDVC